MTATALISVVDDDESIRDSSKALLRSVGFQVAIFESGEQFLESELLALTGCLILDVRMPGMDGLELQRRLSVLQAQLPVIFVTAHSSETNQQLAIAGGASNFFEKPVAASDLLAAVDTALKNRADAEVKRKAAILTA